MTTATATFANATCRSCGQVFTYEPILVGHVDLAKSIHKTCHGCTTKAAIYEKLRRDQARADKIEAEIQASIPPDLFATDIRHPGFNSALWEAVSLWSPTPSEFWLGIVGAADKSKTRCMAMLAMRSMRDGIRSTWTTANRLKDASDDRKSRERGLAANAREHIQECLTSPWLFIDDLGKNEWSPAFEALFFQILDHRKNHRLPIVYSSNAHPDEFSQLISGFNRWPIIGRLLDRTTLFDLRPQ